MSEKGSSDKTLIMWVVFAIIFLLSTLVLAGLLVYVVMNNPTLKWTINKPLVSGGGGDGGIDPVSGGSSGERTHSGESDSNVFAELTKTEIENIMKFLKSDKVLNLTDSNVAKTTDNYVFMLEAIQPSKAIMLNYLDGEEEEKPTREALAVVMEGKASRVREFRISNLPNPTSKTEIRSIPWRKRPRLAPAEVRQMTDFLKKELKIAAEFMINQFGYKFTDCSDNCLDWTFSSPPTPSTNTRNTWIVFRLPYSSSSVHALPLYILVNDQSQNPNDWTVEKVVYKLLVFNSVTSMLTANVQTIADKMPVNLTAQERAKTSMKPSLQENPSDAPKTKGEGRYYIDGQRVKYFNWDFEFRHRISNGLQLFNIRFDQVRVVYELSIQGIMSFYSGKNPFMMHARYLENLHPLGFQTSNLVDGMDCPSNADYFDGYFYSPDTGKAEKRPRHVCVFEHDSNVPLKRHRSSTEYGGIPDKNLVVRTIQTFGDKDFIFDYIFHNNGAIGVKFYVTGYVLGTFWSTQYEEEEVFGYPISKNQLSPITEHLVNYKVDIDISGTGNRHSVADIEMYSDTNPYFTGQEIIQRQLIRNIRETEEKATLKYDLSDPKMLLFYNDTNRNRFGKHKAYRLMLGKIAKNIIPEGWKWEQGFSWARYQVAVTKRKEEEDQSCSMYDASDPYNPIVQFQDFINDKEPIIDQDLVAWVTVGSYRLPTTNDVPLASVLDTEGSFQLVPFNYFDEDPCKKHKDWVYMKLDT